MSRTKSKGTHSKSSKALILGKVWRDMQIMAHNIWKNKENEMSHSALRTYIPSLPFLPHDDIISFQVTHVNGFSLLNHIGMRSQEKPTNMCKEESSLGVMWIGICFRIFMVNTMVVGPSVSVSLWRSLKAKLWMLCSVIIDFWEFTKSQENIDFVGCLKLRSMKLCTDIMNEIIDFPMLIPAETILSVNEQTKTIRRWKQILKHFP